MNVLASLHVGEGELRKPRQYSMNGEDLLCASTHIGLKHEYLLPDSEVYAPSVEADPHGVLQKQLDRRNMVMVLDNKVRFWKAEHAKGYVAIRVIRRPCLTVSQGWLL